MLSPSINNLIRSLKKLPSVGERTAERYVLHLLKSGKKEVHELITALGAVMESVKSCEVCWNFSETSPCTLCRDPRRDDSALCVVLDPPEVGIVEGTGAFRGRYHLVRGLLDPTDPDSLKNSKIPELLKRARPGAKVREIILALNPDMAGESTMLFLEKELKRLNPKLIVTRLARGLPLGADIRYADDVTLGNAIKYRTGI